MKPREMLAMVRKLIADEQATGFTEGGNMEEPEGTQELLNYLNRAVDEYSKRQANKKDARLMKESSVRHDDSIPDDFLSFCGCMPLNIIGKKFSFYIKPEKEEDKLKTMDIRYMARLPYVTDYYKETGTEENLPYDDDQAIAISALAAIYALNKNEYNVSQHLLLMGYGVKPNAGE